MELTELTIEDLSFDFKGKKVFENFNLNLEKDGILPTVILGPSGCGKTTLLRLISGFLSPSKGKVNVQGNVSIVYQEPRFLPWFTIKENIALPLEKELGKKESRDRALHYLKMFSLENLASSYPASLSGGQQQRASVARAFAYPSKILLMDEPFQSLDIPLRIELMDLCLSLLADEKRLTLAVTHDPREAVYLANRIIVFSPEPAEIIFDERVDLSAENRGYGTAPAGALEKQLIEKLKKRLE